MLRSLFITGAYLAFLVAGSAVPFVFSLGYVWVDTFRPQAVTYLILNTVPVSLIMGVGAVGSYILVDRRDPAPLGVSTVLTLMLAVWVTVTMAWAVVPQSAWVKWDSAFKVLVFSAFLPCVFRSRVQIEAFLQVWIFSLCIFFMPFGFKTIISGGGYGRYLGIVGGNSGLVESSTLAAVSMMAVPIMLYLRGHSILLPRIRATQLMYAGLAALAVAAAVGSFARTGLVGMVVVAVGLTVRSRHKFIYLILIGLGAALVGALASQAWTSRISTIDDPTKENSALGRILVWQWTIGYAIEHPLGGGFNAYLISQIMEPTPGGEVKLVVGKAFHNIFIEVLGEHGWIGLGLFSGMMLSSLLIQQQVIRRTHGVPELQWCNELARTLQISLITLLICGMFIGIAFQSMLYYLVAITTCLSHHCHRAIAAQRNGTLPFRPLGNTLLRSDGTLSAELPGAPSP